jgi:sulfofructose kinase
MSSPQVVGIGFAALDVVLRMDRMPTWDHAPPLVDFEVRGGGPAGTACVAASKLGARVGFIGTAGNDKLAELKLGSLEEHGVDISRMVRRNALEDQIIIVYLDAATGERLFAGVAGRDRLELMPEEIDFDYLLSADYLHLDGRYPLAALAAARRMREAGKLVMLDGGATMGRISDEMSALARETDVLICGSGFAPALTGRENILDAGKACLDFGPRIVVTTDGENGSHTFTGNEHFHIPAFEVVVADTTGAGDVFHGAYLVALLHGWGPHVSGHFASAAAAIKCTRLGGRVGFPRFDETAEFLSRRGISLPGG